MNSETLNAAFSELRSHFADMTGPEKTDEIRDIVKSELQPQVKTFLSVLIAQA